MINEERKANKPVLLLLQSLFLIVFLFSAVTQNRQLPVAVPGCGEEAGLAWNWTSISSLETSADLPGVREMLMHRAYQESLPYGGTWSMPAEGESLTLPVYAMEEGRIRSSLKVVQHYNQEWLNVFLNEMSLEGPGILLKSEPVPRHRCYEEPEAGSAYARRYCSTRAYWNFGNITESAECGCPTRQPVRGLQDEKSFTNLKEETTGSMKRLNTFPKGGIHPRDCKEASCDRAIQNASMSSTAVIPLSQHIGAPSECLVKKGDTIEEGQLLGKSGGFVSANIHSSVPGEVKEIKNIYLPNGISTPAVVIEMQGEFSRLGKEISPESWEDLSNEELTGRISEMGIVGQGGATFPTHVKLAVPKGKNCEVFIINAVECEPYLTSDHRVMMEKGPEVLEGIRIIQKILNPQRTVIGVEANKMDAVEHLSSLISQAGFDMEVMPLQVKYPQGAEKNLIKAVTGKEVPSGKLPLEVGVINANVGTCLSIYEAVVLRKPVIERVVTVSGGAIKNPSNLKARIGTSFRTLIEDCGGFSEEPVKIIAGRSHDGIYSLRPGYSRNKGYQRDPGSYSQGDQSRAADSLSLLRTLYFSLSHGFESYEAFQIYRAQSY